MLFCCLLLKSITKTHKNNKIDTQRLKENVVKQKVPEELRIGLEEIMTTPEGPLQQWNRIAQAIRNTSEKHLKSTRVKKKEWMTHEILTLMHQRRIFKNKNREEYRSLHKTRGKLKLQRRNR